MTTRPETPEISEGDLLFVRRSPNDMRGRDESERYIPARVVKAARVWIVLEATGEGALIGHAWRMRRDTRDEATQYISDNASFVTPEQKAWDEAQHEAEAFLREQGISIEWTGPWHGREQELADLIRKAA